MFNKISISTALLTVAYIVWVPWYVSLITLIALILLGSIILQAVRRDEQKQERIDEMLRNNHDP